MGDTHIPAVAIRQIGKGKKEIMIGDFFIIAKKAKWMFYDIKL